MISIGKIKDNPRLKDGYRLIKYLLYGRTGSRETRQSQPFGIDSVPPIGSNIVHADTGITGESINLGVVDENNRKANVGEMRLFAVDENGNQVGELYLTKDGVLRLMEGTDNAVRYSKLEVAFNELKADYNDLSLKWSTFANAYVAGGPSVQGLPPTASASSQSSADITLSKIDEINVP